MTMTKSESMAQWSARVHGPEWQAFKRRYWAHPLTRKRCFWCRRKGRRQLNHLTYRPYPDSRPPRMWQVKPLCLTCHRVETWLTRRYRPGMSRRRQRWAHAYVTYGVRWALYAPLWALVAWTYTSVR